MDFEFSDEQRMLGDMLGSFIVDRYGFEARQCAMREAGGFSRATWRELAELGILGLPFSAEDGGFGGGGIEMMIVMEAFGRGLVVEPFLATVILAGGALRLAGSAAQKGRRIGEIIAGARLMALAHHEPGGLRHTVDRFSTNARLAGGGWRLSGRKVSVISGASADELVVSAACDEGVALFLVDPTLPGVTVTARTGFDGTALADVVFYDVDLPADALLGAPGEGAPILSRLFEEANAALCAEAVEIMADAFDMTTEYLKTRSQFGVSIGRFQALQHRAVDMLMQLEQARSMAILAALSLDRGPEERWRNIAAAKAKIGQAGKFVGQSAVQMHGAIGLTMEYKVGHAFKRLTAIDMLFGDSDYHIDALANAGGLLPID